MKRPVLGKCSRADLLDYQLHAVIDAFLSKRRECLDYRLYIWNTDAGKRWLRKYDRKQRKSKVEQATGNRVGNRAGNRAGNRGKND